MVVVDHARYDLCIASHGYLGAELHAACQHDLLSE